MFKNESLKKTVVPAALFVVGAQWFRLDYYAYYNAPSMMKVLFIVFGCITMLTGVYLLTLNKAVRVAALAMAGLNSFLWGAVYFRGRSVESFVMQGLEATGGFNSNPYKLALIYALLSLACFALLIHPRLKRLYR